MSICNVCVEKLNRSRRKNVVCFKCKYEACKECYQTFIINSDNFASCMNCKTEWDYSFLLQNFTKKFINNDYKKHQQNILFKQESTLLAETQLYIERKKKESELVHNIRIKQLRITCIRKRLKIQKNKTYIFEQVDHNIYDQTILENTIDELQKEIGLSEKELENLKNSNSSKNFIKKCTNGECKGFINTDYNCGMCNTMYCNLCHEIKNASHICNRDQIKNIEFLKNDTKPCPSCKIPIHKTEGCDQMFCTECYTVFSWNTGTIEKGKVHNPHYQELVRKGIFKRDPLDVECNRNISLEFIQEYCQFGSRLFYNLCKHLITVRHFQFQKYTETIDNQDSRIKYLYNVIDENSFKKILHKNYKTNTYNKEILSVLDTFISSFSEILFKYYAYIRVYDPITRKSILENLPTDTTNLTLIDTTFIIEILNLLTIINHSIQNINTTYGLNDMELTFGLHQFTSIINTVYF